MPNPDGSFTDDELEASRLDDATYMRIHGRTREQAMANLKGPGNSVEELLERVIERLDIVIDLLKRDRRD
jgi:hypothetical protein